MTITDEELQKIESELLEKIRNLSPQVRAEVIITQYCDVMGKNELLDKLFEEWLADNALLALETSAIEEYFFRLTDRFDRDTEYKNEDVFATEVI